MNNFNTGLDDDGTVRMLEAVRFKEIRAYFHPTELFKGSIGEKSWQAAKEAVTEVKESIDAVNVNVPPLLAVYNSFNAARSPDSEPQQISDPMIMFEFLNFKNYMQTSSLSVTPVDQENEMAAPMPVAAY